MNLTSLGQSEQPKEQVNVQQGQLQFGQLPTREGTFQSEQPEQVAVEGETNEGDECNELRSK